MRILLTNYLNIVQNTMRVPNSPAWYPFAWIVEMSRVTEDDLLKMIGLDGYMMIRFLNICIRISAFLTFLGIVILVPVYYSTAPSELESWNKYTLANIPNNPRARQLWVPVIFSYVFTAYYCYLFQAEYKNFMKKRLQYLVQCDSDTPAQTYYTVMVERLPSQLRSVPKLYEFFDRLFPGKSVVNIFQVFHANWFVCEFVVIVQRKCVFG